jgi:hypothetical protein
LELEVRVWYYFSRFSIFSMIFVRTVWGLAAALAPVVTAGNVQLMRTIIQSNTMYLSVDVLINVCGFSRMQVV